MPADPTDQPQLIAVADGLHVRQEVDNIAWADLGGYAIVVDALERPELEDEVFAAIADTLGDTPVRYVLNTHTHYDHTALNPAFERRCGAEVVNQRTADIPADGRWFQGESRRAQMLPMPGCHTREDCIVWVPEAQVLFVGDIFGWGLIPVMTRLNEATAQHLLDTYGRLIDFGAETVVPGHGPLCSTTELRRWTEYFTGLRDAVSRAVAEGKSDTEVLDAVPPPEDMADWWRFRQWKHEDSVTKVLGAVRRGDL
ncbi:MAG: MBL fold metallo-hydrolase [bacterium]